MVARIEDQDALDLVVQHGRVVDPGSGLDATLDIGVRYGRIVAIEPDLSLRIAQERSMPPMDRGTIVIDAAGAIVSPGFIDLHTHVFVGICALTVPADETAMRSGVTTVVSAGDAGAHTVEGFRRLVVESSRTRVLAFLHVSSVGLSPWPAGEARDLDLMDVPAAIRAGSENRDFVAGVKVRMGGPWITGSNGAEPLRRAILIAEALHVPVMVHIGDSTEPLAVILEMLRRGDVVTHCFAGSTNTLIDGERLDTAALEARSRGVLFDVGHGTKSFSFRTADVAVKRGFWPDTISTDLHSLSVDVVTDLPTTMAKFLDLGMPLEAVLASVTSQAAKAVGREATIGSIALGREADLAIFAVVDRPQVVRDSLGVSRTLKRSIVVSHTIRAGLPWLAPMPHPGHGTGLERRAFG